MKDWSKVREAMRKLDNALPDYIFDDEGGEGLANIISNVWDAINEEEDGGFVDIMVERANKIKVILERKRKQWLDPVSTEDTITVMMDELEDYLISGVRGMRAWSNDELDEEICDDIRCVNHDMVNDLCQGE